jgi:hypothetical protein
MEINVPRAIAILNMKVFMGQKDLNKDFEQAAMCNSRDLKYVCGLF